MKIFLQCVLIGFLHFNFCSAHKINVLLIIVDDLKPAIRSYGDMKAYTPNIDELASRSFVFTKAYAQQALCAPSRNSLLTSRRPDSLHLYDFYSYWRTTVGNFTTLPQHFKENDYHTYSVGKIFHPGISSNFSDDCPYSWSQKPFHPKAQLFKNLCKNGDGTFSENLICPVIVEFQPYGTLPDIESMEEAVAFLKSKKKIHKSENKPYFLAVGFHKPHIPFKFPETYLDYHPLENVSLPINRARPSLLPDVAWNPWTDIRKRDDIKKLNIPFPYGPVPDDVIKRIVQGYYASVTYIDDVIGNVLKEVDLKNTVVVFTGDHGWSLSQHGEFSKYSNFEEATRVPLIIHVPNLSKGKVVVKSLVELVDIFPTLVDLTQVSDPLNRCPNSIDKNKVLCTEGQSLVPVMIEALEKQRVRGKSAVFSQYPRPTSYPTLHPNSDKPHLHEIKIMGYSVTTKRYRYCEWIGFNPTNFSVDWNKVYGKEMYDHLIDPEENMNLVDNKELQKLVKHLRRILILGWRHV